MLDQLAGRGKKEAQSTVILIEKQAVGPSFKNGFVVACPRTREAVLIDPGDEVPGLLAFATREALAIQSILLTHAHVDPHHRRSGGEERASTRQFIFTAMICFFTNAPRSSSDVRGLHLGALPPVDQFLQGRSRRSRSDSCEVRVHHTPGHCPGGVCLQIGETGQAGMDLFVGDTLFFRLDRPN